MKKGVFLFLALLLPVLIFIFLRSFGKNEFAVPVLFADSVSSPSACTAYVYSAPYTVADSVLQAIGWRASDSLTVIVFSDTVASRRQEQEIHLNRVRTEFKNQSFQIRYITHTIDSSAANAAIKLSKTTLAQMRSCVFLLNATDDAVIVDAKKQLRGQYNLQKREEADRMIMQEMNILFKRY